MRRRSAYSILAVQMPSHLFLVAIPMAYQQKEISNLWSGTRDKVELSVSLHLKMDPSGELSLLRTIGLSKADPAGGGI